MKKLFMACLAMFMLSGCITATGDFLYIGTAAHSIIPTENGLSFVAADDSVFATFGKDLLEAWLLK
jgi:hypothetical protein